MTYPVEQVEYGTYRWLQQELGGQMFGQYNPDALNPEQKGKVNSVIERGYRQMLHPVPMEGQQAPHRWSFLTTVGDIKVEANTRVYDLPDDFSGVVGEMTILVQDYDNRPVFSVGT